MTPFTVTKATNVKPDGSLISEAMIGIVNQVTTLTFSYTKTDEAGNQSLETGLITKALVLWDNDRVPRLEALEDLLWLELLDGSEGEEEEEDEDDDEVSEERGYDFDEDVSAQA